MGNLILHTVMHIMDSMNSNIIIDEMTGWNNCTLDGACNMEGGEV